MRPAWPARRCSIRRVLVSRFRWRRRLTGRGTAIGNGHTRLYIRGVLGLTDLAHELGADERTLRRAVTDGTVRCERLTPRKGRVSDEERRYVLEHWPLLAQLRRALRTEDRK